MGREVEARMREVEVREREVVRKMEEVMLQERARHSDVEGKGRLGGSATVEGEGGIGRGGEVETGMKSSKDKRGGEAERLEETLEGLMSMKAESERLATRLVQLHVWGEVRQLQLWEAAQVQAEGLHRQVEERGKQAHVWHAVSEQLLADQRVLSVSHCLGRVRHTCLSRALRMWQLGAQAIMCS
ncbi:MAG: hypothetical protein SGPRY_012329 [Prymnesium sp.]